MDIHEINNQAKTEEDQILEAFNALLEAYKVSNHRQKSDLIIKAFNFSNKAHRALKRRSGEPYIMHPIAVARIVCSEMGLGSTSICSALLHDVVEDTPYRISAIEALYKDDNEAFGKKVGEIVEGLTKLSHGRFAQPAADHVAQKESDGDSKQIENFRKLFLTMNDDIRVVLIKLADRLHNMRTLDAMPQEKKHKITGETLFLYAPLAHRLGLYAVKTELENLCLKYEKPEAYENIDLKLNEIVGDLESIFEKFARPLHYKLKATGIDYAMAQRLKSHFSIWSKMEKRALPFEEIYDLFAVRIVFASRDDVSDRDLCWRIYTIITDIYKINPERIRDFTANPKANGYQALHVTVMGPDGMWVEVQIRSRRMDDIAERGLAAHWKYKDHNIEEDKELTRLLDNIKQILKNPTPDQIDELDNLKLTLYESEILVFTPSGELRTLPKGATALDFAYDLHSNIGNTAVAAKINHTLVPLSKRLANGDQVEIVTSKSQTPEPEWLTYVNTAKARLDINTALKRVRRKMVEPGKAKLLAAFEKAGIEPLPSQIDKVAVYYGFTDRDDLFCAIEKGNVSNYENVKRILRTKTDLFEKFMFFRRAKKRRTASDSPATKFNTKAAFILTEEGLNKEYTLATCCNPIPGDETLGFVDKDKLVVHKRLCTVAINRNSKYGDLVIATVWSKYTEFYFDAIIQIKGIDAVGILSNIAGTISTFNVNILKLIIESSGGVFEGKIKLKVHNVEDVRQLCFELGKLKNISLVSRIE